MNDSSLEHLISMANQIAENLRYASPDDKTAAEAVAKHIKRFWARPMKTRIRSYADTDGSDLSEVAKLAVDFL